MAKQRKPRTIAEALDHWASFIAGQEVGPTFDVSSVMLHGDTVYHYGTHYPMAKIVRKVPKDAPRYGSNDGPVVAVYVNAQRWGGSSGWGQSTDSLVRDLRSLVTMYAQGIPVYDVRLSNGQGGSGPVLVEELDTDREPITVDRMTIPVCPAKVIPVDPGPEPVKSDAGCIAGTFETFEASEDVTLYAGEELRPGDFIIGRRESYRHDGTYYYTVRRAMMLTMYYGEHRDHWQAQHSDAHRADIARMEVSRNNYKQCPHCRAHDNAHDRWSIRYNGGHNYRSGERVRMGWKQYSELLALFGDRATWQHARSAMTRHKRARDAEHAAWVARNSVPFSQVPEVRKGNVTVPEIDPATGKVTRAMMRKWQRERKAAQRRHRADVKRRNEEIAQEEARREAERVAAIARAQETRARWSEEGVETGDLAPNVVEWLQNNGLTPNTDGTVRLVKRLDTVQEENGATLRPRAGNRAFVYPQSGPVVDPNYVAGNRCGNGLHWSATFAQATEVFYGDTMIEADVDLVTMHVVWDNKVKAASANVVRVVPENEWKAAQS